MKTARAKLTGNMLIAQSGGPTVVINQSLVGAVLEAKRHPEIKRIFGARHGIKGILSGDFLDLGRESTQTLDAVARTPSAALGSVRKRPTHDDCVKLFGILQGRKVRYFFYIGGNDSAETAFIINEEAKKVGYDLRCFHIPKTIDNDLRENDHTPGYGSGARFVACAFMGDNLDNRALPGVKINIVMGRSAGFLTAASALARNYPDDGPHLIYLPERAFDLERFAAEVKAIYGKYGRCVVAASEGIVDKNQKSIAAAFIREVDSHGNVQLSGSGALGDLLAGYIRQRTEISRVRADTLGYLQRSFPGVVSPVDAREARNVGVLAVRFAVKSNADGSVAIRRKHGRKYEAYFELVPLISVSKETKQMPDAFINDEGNDVTPAFLNYARPLVGELPRIGRFRGAGMTKRS